VQHAEPPSFVWAAVKKLRYLDPDPQTTGGAGPFAYPIDGSSHEKGRNRERAAGGGRV
jgi:hypothetical protein